MSTSLAEKFGINIEPSQLTERQKERLNSHDYYFEAAQAISLGIDALIRVDRSEKKVAKKVHLQDS